MQLSSAVLDLLNTQYAHEKRNQLIYESMASAVDFIGLSSTAAFLKKQAAGEAVHAKAVYDYINQRNQHAAVSQIEVPAVSGDFFTIFDDVMAVEIATTEKLTSLAQRAFAEGDLMTFFWASDLIKEQIEEENIIQTIIDRFESCGQDKSQIALLDQWIGAL